MKKTLLFSFAILLTTTVFAQKKEVMKHNEATNLVEATYFHDNGQISQIGTFDTKGKLHGKWTSFSETGEKLSEGSYLKGKRTGTWLFWNADVVKEVRFDENGIVSVVNKDSNSGLVIKD
ncbi:MAG: nicotinic acid mononucleotide adenyltransferase [Flavobacteriaceae bacterium]|nr:nicotinic acid mononucleotide adenyltransferase [Flavobacteriaceae bacterium]